MTPLVNWKQFKLMKMSIRQQDNNNKYQRKHSPTDRMEFNQHQHQQQLVQVSEAKRSYHVRERPGESSVIYEGGGGGEVFRQEFGAFEKHPNDEDFDEEAMEEEAMLAP